MKTLLILGHPRQDSFCHALADAYEEGARNSGADLRRLNLSELEFEQNVEFRQPQSQHREPDIVRSLEWIKWADHLVFVYPVWWGMMPALLKGFLDRTFLPGFAFYEAIPGDYRGLLHNRTAQLLVAMDTPAFIHKLLNKAPAENAMKTATLGLCGIGPTKTRYFSPITHSTAAQREKWLQEAKILGARSTEGVATPWDMFRLSATPWLKALRLQFYPMTFVAFMAGAFAATYSGGHISWLKFLLSYAVIFLIEVMAVFINEYEDLKADAVNRLYGPFNGGSRVLVNKEIAPEKMAGTLKWVVTAIMGLSALAIWLAGTNAFALYIAIAVTFFLAAAYTLPPLKFSYRTLGELTVGITHSICVIMIGYLAQGGSPTGTLPWLIGLPLFMSILPSITMSNVPDRLADAYVNKKTIAVRFGPNAAAWFALVTTWLALALAAWVFSKSSLVYSWVIFLAVPHAILLSIELRRFIRYKNKPGTINKLMVLALTYMMWFVIVPVFVL